MKKLYQAGIMSAIFLLSGFIAMNMYSSTSFPGFHSDAPCNLCHNDPVYALDVEGEINTHVMDDAIWSEHAQWSTNYVPLINTNNRTEDEEFTNWKWFTMQFLKNSTHIVFKARIPDTTMTNTDKFAIIWNIDVSNFTVGEFLAHYSDGATTGQMKFTNGHADMWWWSQSTVPANTTAKMGDYYIDTSHYNNDGTGNQDVYLYPYYGGIGGYGNPKGYIIYFVRALTTSDTNDVQFEDGDGIQYALAHWDDSGYINHYSSFDKMMIVGDTIGVVNVVTMPVTVEKTVEKTVEVSGEPSGTTSSFTVITLVAGLLFAIPVMTFLRKRK
jgi:hypothetical protein